MIPTTMLIMIQKYSNLKCHYDSHNNACSIAHFEATFQSQFLFWHFAYWWSVNFAKGSFPFLAKNKGRSRIWLLWYNSTFYLIFDATWLIFDKTELIYDTSWLIFNKTELILDISRLIFDKTELIFDKSSLIFCTTQLIFNTSRLIFDKTELKSSHILYNSTYIWLQGGGKRRKWWTWQVYIGSISK